MKKLEFKYKVAICWVSVFYIWSILVILFSKGIRDNNILSLIMISIGFIFMFLSPFVGLWIVKDRKKKVEK